MIGPDVLGRGRGGTSVVDMARVDLPGRDFSDSGDGKNFLSSSFVGVTGVCGHRCAESRLFILVE